MNINYDLIIIGGGHAGCEAAMASARMGFSTLMLTMRKGRVAHMPCNPAVGGLAKGHLVKEIDALGGEMGSLTDQAGIQFRMLNRAKGPAVWSPRAQVDKALYHKLMAKRLEAVPGLQVEEAEVTGIVMDHYVIKGVKLSSGTLIGARACILTAGTFLKGLLHIGGKKLAGGREGDPGAGMLSESLAAQGFRVGRLKTGTPPRVLAVSVDLATMAPQSGDEKPVPFSFRTKTIGQEQVLCYLTHTNEKTHQIIRENLHRSPLYAGEIKGIGPRYCPSIEDKVVRFPDRDGHQIFIEPEGKNHPELYVNGLSTSMPVDVQLEVLHSIPGLERAVMKRAGYAVEYDFFPPDQIGRTMETKEVQGLYFAGQVNGTSGYEEAAAQGLMAGINASLQLMGREMLVLGRDEAYTGVLIDDLTTKEIDEPYRMFTSRAEFRLLLRQDNADERLMHYGQKLGLVPAKALERVQLRKKAVARLMEELESTAFPRQQGNELFASYGLGPVNKMSTMLQVLKRPEVRFDHLRPLLRDGHGAGGQLASFLECAVKYTGYIERQEREIRALRELEARTIPSDFPFAKIPSLSAEARQKLASRKPETVAQASRISGVRAADLSIIVIHLERYFSNSRSSKELWKNGKSKAC